MEPNLFAGRSHKRKLKAAEKRNAAFHEAGHSIAAKHFGLGCHAYIISVKDPTPEQKTYIGQTRFGNATQSRAAVIAWSGLIAEYLGRTGKPVKEWPNEDIETFEDETFFDEQSVADAYYANAHPQRRRALKTSRVENGMAYHRCPRT